MEGTPEYLDYEEIMTTFLTIEGVMRVHNLRIWVKIRLRLLLIMILLPDFMFYRPQALSVNKIALAVHLAVRKYQLPCSISVKHPAREIPNPSYLLYFVSFDAHRSIERYHFPNVENRQTKEKRQRLSRESKKLSKVCFLISLKAIVIFLRFKAS